MARVFISYVRENKAAVDRLVSDLESAGVSVWLDTKQLRPGQRWADQIRQGIAEGDFFIACFSAEFEAKSRTHMNEELTLAIEELRKRPIEQTWFIPLRVNDCTIPDRSIGAGDTLRSLQWVDLISDWDDGVRRILSVVRPQHRPMEVSAHDLRVLTHEILSPLQGILGNVELLSRPDFPEKSRERAAEDAELFARLIAYQVRGFGAAVNVLQREITLYPSDVDVSRELKEVVRQLAPLARDRKLEIRLSGLQKLPKKIEADQQLLSLLFFSMLDNAIRYSYLEYDRRRDECHNDGSLLIDASRSSSEAAVLQFVNRCKYLRVEDMPHLFDLGFRGENALRTSPSGTGRGLFLAKRVAEAHGGSVSFRLVKEGSLVEFTVTLPASLPRNSDDRE